MRLAHFAVLLLAIGCSRTTESAPRAVAERPYDAGAEAAASAVVVDAGDAKVESGSPLSIIARMPMSGVPREPSRVVGSPLPLVQRLSGGGVLVASEYARARAEGGGALAVEYVTRGLEDEIRSRRSVMQQQGYDAVRWVWSDTSVEMFVYEEETSRSGPRLMTFKAGANGFASQPGSKGYWSAVRRGGAILALSRTAYEVPNSSIYPKGSEYEANSWDLRPAVVAVLSNGGAAPVIPKGVCPQMMSAGVDGSLLIAVDGCKDDSSSAKLGVLRYAPGATEAKVEWFASVSTAGDSRPEVAVHAVSANEAYVGFASQLHTWNGKEWATTEPFGRAELGSISRAPGGELWATLGDGRLMRRGADNQTWSPVPLPSTPIGPLDDKPYGIPQVMAPELARVEQLNAGEEPRTLGTNGSGVQARWVDATAPEILVLGLDGFEAFLMSTTPRAPIARIPTVSTQRARILGALEARTPKSLKDCTYSGYVLLSEGMTADKAVDVAVVDGGEIVKIAEVLVGGQKRLAVLTEDDALTKKLTTLGAKRVCGPAVVERYLRGAPPRD